MRSFDRLQTSCIRVLPAAALLAAVFVPLLPASAADDCPPDGCPIPLPQSREVNPAPAHADGSAVQVPKAGELPPVEITVHVLAPTFVDPAPMGASFEAISVPVRYQAPGDVSCGAQALGMALDALPGAAPTSASLLGLLQDNGMMYDFGTGVEELAYAAQSFGYTGSFAFHGASFEQLQAQLAAGSPVVVSLGANGERQPGHFVTVTGISSDGRWVAYNDPSLGEQVISASEFERLWGLQGNSGVAVASEPPAEVADPGVLALWVAFAAGLMALVSTTPLAKLRQGIGGMLDAGGGGNYTPVRSAPKSSPPAKEKEKEKEPKKSKPRFDDEIAGVTSPPKTTSSVVATPSEVNAAQATAASRVMVTPTESRAAQDPSDQEEDHRSVIYSPSQATQGTPREEDKDPEPAPKPVATPGKREMPATTLLTETTENDEPPESTATPSPQEEDFAAIVTQTPTMPEGYVAPGIKDLPFTLADIIRWDARGVKVVRGIDRTLDAMALTLKELDGGYVSVSAPALLRDDLGLAGTRYLPSTVSESIGSSLVKGSVGKSNILISLVASVGVNLYDYGLGEHKDEGIGSQEFWVSTGVDFGTALFIGAAAATAVAAVAIGATALFGIVVEAPVLLAGVAMVALVASVAIEVAGVSSKVKEEVSNFVDELDELIPDPPPAHPAPKSPPGSY